MRPRTRAERVEAAVQVYLGGLRPPRAENAAALEGERRAAYRLECRGLFKANGVETRFTTASVYDVPAPLPEGYRKLAGVLVEMIDAPQLLAVCGDRGRGKTHLACGLVNAFCELRRPAVYRRTRDFFDELSGTEWANKDRVRNKYAHVDLLVLDEVQVRDADREWQDNELTTLIDRRYACALSTLVLSNLKPAALMQNLGESIWRRLIETGGVVETQWPRIAEVLA